MGKLERLEARRLDEMVRTSMANEVYKRIRESESVRYAIGAMQPIDPAYTRKTFEEGDRIKNQLSERLLTSCAFEYQGSTDTDTHIKARSDVDLLEIRTGWIFKEPPQDPSPRYQGDETGDMRALRRESVTALTAAFPRATVDESKSTCIKVAGGSLTRDVDVVPAIWLNTNAYAQTGLEVFRGVKVFNKDTSEFAANTPRLHKRRIEEKDQLTRGGLRKAARLLKTLRYDSDGRADMSSYNIVSIVYNIPDHQLTVQAPKELAILEACYEFCDRLTWDAALRATILVPDGSRTVFGSEPAASFAQLQALTKEINDLRLEILRENARSWQRLIEARVEYPQFAS